jgi:hypothetical protein
VLAFALGYLMIYTAMHAQEEVAQATLKKDAAQVKEQSAISGSSMMLANRLAIASVASFFVGSLIGIVAFLSF